VQGGGIYRDTLGADTLVAPGDLILVNPRVGHTYGPEREQDWHEYYVSFQGPLFDTLESCGVLDPAKPVRRLGDAQPWRDRFAALFPPPGVKRQPTACEQLGGLVELLLSAAESCSASGAARTGPVWLTRATNLLATPGAATADLKTTAKACGLGYENFRKQFAALTGESPAAYRRRALVERAQRLMRERDLTDRAIADALGFCDEFHFSKTFKHVAGLSPRAWRTRYRRDKPV
jgi:AraC-like DNA-binding protein